MRSAKSPSEGESVSAVKLNWWMVLPPVVWTLSTLSFPPASGWKALANGADTEKTAHCPYVAELEAPAGGALTMDW